MDVSDKATVGLIGSIVNNMQIYEGNFFDNRKDCPFVDNVMNWCENDNNPTVSCDWEHCPLGELV